MQCFWLLTFDILQLIDGKRTSKTKGGCSKILVCTEQYLYHKNRDHQGKDGWYLPCSLVLIMFHCSAGGAGPFLTAAPLQQPSQEVEIWNLVWQGSRGLLCMKSTSQTVLYMSPRNHERKILKCCILTQEPIHWNRYLKCMVFDLLSIQGCIFWLPCTFFGTYYQ